MALEGELSRRHRVRDNLPGTPQFCPMVRWTPALREQAQRNLSGEARASHVVGGGAGRRERHNASPDARPVVWLHRHGHVRPGAVRGEEGFPTGRCAVNRCFIRVYRYRAGRLQHSLGPEWIHVPPGVGHTPVLRQQADHRRAAITGGPRLPERCRDYRRAAITGRRATHWKGLRLERDAIPERSPEGRDYRRDAITGKVTHWKGLHWKGLLRCLRGGCRVTSIRRL